jgi:hypothetical protein
MQTRRGSDTRAPACSGMDNLDDDDEGPLCPANSREANQFMRKKWEERQSPVQSHCNRTLIRKMFVTLVDAFRE